MAGMELALLIVAVAFDFAKDLVAHNRNKRDHSPADNSMPMDYFADHTNRNNIEEAP